MQQSAIDIELGHEAHGHVRAEVQMSAAMVFFIEFVRSQKGKKIEVEGIRSGLCDCCSELSQEYANLQHFASALYNVMKPNQDVAKLRKAV